MLGQGVSLHRGPQFLSQPAAPSGRAATLHELRSKGGVQESFLDELLEAEIFGELLEAFNALPPACREVYRLSLEGKPHEEIAELLNISIITIKKHKNNANHFMRKRLKHLLVVEYLLLIDRLTDLLN